MLECTIPSSCQWFHTFPLIHRWWWHAALCQKRQRRRGLEAVRCTQWRIDRKVFLKCWGKCTLWSQYERQKQQSVASCWGIVDIVRWLNSTGSLSAACSSDRTVRRQTNWIGRRVIGAAEKKSWNQLNFDLQRVTAVGHLGCFTSPGCRWRIPLPCLSLCAQEKSTALKTRPVNSSSVSLAF